MITLGGFFMSRRTTKHTLEERYQAVSEYLSGQYSKYFICRKYTISKNTFDNWIRKYKAGGLDGLKESRTWKEYSVELKTAAVLEYLDNKRSPKKICDKYNISSVSVLRKWINLYTNGKGFKATIGGRNKMKHGRKTTFKERLEIVQYTLANNKNYHKAIDKYNVSYSQVYNWVKKFEVDGEKALYDNRGKTVKDRDYKTLSETERLKLEILRLKERNKYLETENIVLKKLDELERRR